MGDSWNILLYLSQSALCGVLSRFIAMGQNESPYAHCFIVCLKPRLATIASAPFSMISKSPKAIGLLMGVGAA